MKGLEALKRTRWALDNKGAVTSVDLDAIEKALTEYEKQKQILEVLKNKQVNIRRAILLRKNYQDYLENYGNIFEDVEPKLTETEFNLIKEWLK